MYITKEELERRLNKTELFVNERERKERGKEKRLSHEDRVIIGILEKEDTQKNIAELVGVSPNTVSLVSRNITSPQLGVDQDLKQDIEKTVAEKGKSRIEDNKKIEDQLITNLAAALGHVANNLDGTDAVEASKIASDMSKILDRVSPDKDKEHRGNRTAIIINVPSMKEEKSYQTIDV